MRYARFAAHKTIEISLALNLVRCFIPLESPESGGMAGDFVKIFKRDYVRSVGTKTLHASRDARKSQELTKFSRLTR